MPSPVSAAVVLVWLGTEPQLEAAEPALESWARARGVAVSEASADSSALVPAVDPELVAQVERDLERARIADAALDDARARAALGAVARTLSGHPELPQAAWLLAAHERLRASVERRGTGGAEAARAAEAHADALEGELAQAFGADTSAAAPPAAAPPLVPVRGLRRGERLVWNGAPLATDRVPSSPGRHHALVVRDAGASAVGPLGEPDSTVWAAWIDVAPGTTSVALARPPVSPCSLEDLDGAGIVRVAGRPQVRARDGTTCARWIVARARARGAIEVAWCHEASCGPLLPWRAGWGRETGGPAQPPAAPHPARTGEWLVAGAGALLAGVFVAWRVGAFDREPTGPPRFVYEPPR